LDEVVEDQIELPDETPMEVDQPNETNDEEERIEVPAISPLMQSGHSNVSSAKQIGEGNYS
jgi:hypothetical protein